MTLSLFRLIISVSTMVFALGFLFYTSRRNRNRESINWHVKQGVRCYSCKEEIYDESNIQTEIQREWQKLNKLRSIFDRIEIDPKSEDLHMCTSCNRDNQIDGLIHKKIVSLNSIKKYLYSRKSNTILWIYTILMITTLVLDFVDSTSNKDSLRIFFYLYNFIIFCYWVIMIYKNKLDYIDK
jgi:hypothetical protein